MMPNTHTAPSPPRNYLWSVTRRLLPHASLTHSSINIGFVCFNNWTPGYIDVTMGVTFLRVQWQHALAYTYSFSNLLHTFKDDIIKVLKVRQT